MKRVIFDLDGTLALIDHRRHLVTNGNNKWDEFYERCIFDEVNYPVSIILGKFIHYPTPEIKVEIWSGRSDQVKKQTEEWLFSKTAFNPHKQLLKMRQEGDYTPDDKLKEKWLLEVGADNILMVFDDRQKVVDMWRRYGIACLQVAPGDF